MQVTAITAAAAAKAVAAVAATTITIKVKFSHTRYQALIPVYRQSACR